MEHQFLKNRECTSATAICLSVASWPIIMGVFHAAGIPRYAPLFLSEVHNATLTAVQGTVTVPVPDTAAELEYYLGETESTLVAVRKPQEMKSK
ncbi:hypothetical protein CPLU01_01788 [Colletotrichum plurivorum]|uniref:Uncharacterized protein n=1 Tax=Colletotrichum plurivorum TaxID=2175906 RepID=A0A8H6KY17_9PEZI|nr:hypothetical protein CPLU01_01788 [Colletotrichum plurivorum]